MAYSLLQRARENGGPIAEGDTVTFVWEGATPPTILADFNQWRGGDEASLLEEVEPGIWSHATTLPRDTYLEYVYEVDGERVLDPLNSRTIDTGVGGYHNFLWMPDAAETPLTAELADVPRGEVTTHTVTLPYTITREHRTVRLYRPPAAGPHPLLVVWDGQDYFQRGRLTTILDNLIGRRRVRPIALAMIDHGGRTRSVEYGPSDEPLLLLSNAVMPLARENLDLTDPSDSPGGWGVLGASMGGLMALYTGMRLPHLFGQVLSQSGYFGFTPDERVIGDMVRYFPPRPLTIWMDVGRFEFLLAQNRRTRALLLQTGYAVTYREYNGAHNYTSWRNDVWRGLEALFPPLSDQM
jgi:enterochelin esterase family protein